MFSVQNILCAVLLVLKLAEARIGIGSCAEPPLQQDFELSRYLGQWYGQVEFSAAFNIGVSCSRANYSIKSNGHIKIYNQGYYRIIGRPVSVIGDAFVGDASNPAKLTVNFFKLLPAAEYLVVETDYNTYSVVYSCKELGFVKSETAWVLTRSINGLSVQRLNEILERLSTYGIDPDNFSRINQSNCPL